MGAGQRAPEGVGPGAPIDAIRYRLGERVAARRAVGVAAFGAVTSLAPLVLAGVLLGRLGWKAPASLSAVGVALVGLVLVRAGVAFVAARRRLSAMVIVVTEQRIRVEPSRDGPLIERAAIARIIEIDGPLGGLRLESRRDPRTDAVTRIHVPRGGDAFGELRAVLERWSPVARRGRRGPALRLALGALVVAGLFFLPFLLEDFVARSKPLAIGLVVGLWIFMRAALRRA